MNRQFFDASNRIIEIEHLPYSYTGGVKNYTPVTYDSATNETTDTSKTWDTADAFSKAIATNPENLTFKTAT